MGCHQTKQAEPVGESVAEDDLADVIRPITIPEEGHAVAPTSRPCDVFETAPQVSARAQEIPALAPQQRTSARSDVEAWLCCRVEEDP